VSCFRRSSVGNRISEPFPFQMDSSWSSPPSRRWGDQRLWPWCRQTAWRHVKAVMRAAAIIGPQASPKGLRHGFGIANAQASIPQSLTQRWMGHARLETTGIYQNAVGSEERAFAQRAWVGQSFTSGEP